MSVYFLFKHYNALPHRYACAHKLGCISALEGYEERFKEIFRLKEKNLPKSIIDEHVKGLVEVKARYKDYYKSERLGDRKKFELWKSQYFPDF